MTDTDPPKLPAIASAPLSLILLPGNAAEDVAAVVGRWVTVLNDLKRDYEILLPENLAANLTDRPAKLRTLAGTSIGAVLRAGVKECKHKLVCHVPCEARYDPAVLKEFLKKIDAVHVVTGSRRGQARSWPARGLGAIYRGMLWLVFGVSQPPSPEWPGWRQLRKYVAEMMTWLVNSPGWLGWRHWIEHLLYWLFFGLSFHDSACAFRLMRREVFNDIPLQSEGAFVHVELLGKGRFLGRYYLDEVLLEWPGPADAEPWRQTLAEARRVMSQPEFVRASQSSKKKSRK